MSIPQSNIYVCSDVRLNSDYIHSIYFPDPLSQIAYFEGKVVKTFLSYTYLRKSWDIQVDATMSMAREWTYLFFNNDGKNYYYFINNIEYVNDNTVKLFIELDVIQTYMFDVEFSECFIEREHVDDDTIGLNLVDEGLDLGEHITSHQTQVNLSELCVLVMATFNPNTTTQETTTTRLGLSYHGVFSGVGIYAVSTDMYSEWATLLNKLDGWGKSDGILSMWMYPKWLVELKDDTTWTDSTVCKEVRTVKTDFVYQTDKPDFVAGFKPNNRKLYTYPYSFLYVYNNTGGSAVYRYEFFETSDGYLKFHVRGALSPDGKVLMYPKNYKGCEDNYDEGLTLSGFPTCAWNQDVYKLWLAQNQNQQNLAQVTGALKIAGGVGMATAGLLSGGAVGGVAGLGAAASGIMDIQNQLAQRKDKEIQPPQAKGDHSVSVNVAMDRHTFLIKQQTLTPEQAHIIDEYFDLYGYACKRVKQPSLKNRENWTYIKTVGCHVYGRFCVEDKKKIERIFDNGITFWVNGDDVGKYYLSNKPNSEL